MDKKILGLGLVIIGVAAVIAGVILFTKSNDGKLEPVNNSSTNNQTNQGETDMGKKLVI